LLRRFTLVTTNAGRRAIVIIGWALYGGSFALIAVADLGGHGAPLHGYLTAWFALCLPWGQNLFGHQGLFEHRHLDYLGVLLSGWINPTFLVAAFFVSRRPSARISRMLAIATLAMMPFCWVVFYYQGFYPREGHFVWIAGMLCVLFVGLANKTKLMTSQNVFH
jgi:hypothetical protein